MALKIPARLDAACRAAPETRAWLQRLPDAVDELARRWLLGFDTPFDTDDATCAWVVPVTRADGTRAVLKLAMPHLEGRHEIAGLRFWSGDPTVQLLEADERLGAMLLERCVPGTSLRAIPEREQDVELARLLRRLWRPLPPAHGFQPLAAMLAHWGDEALARREGWHDTDLVSEGLRLFDELARTSAADVLLATDLHAGNVLRAEREPWLVIDPKPFVGDPAYDATQHLLNCRPRLFADPVGTIRRFAELVGVDDERVRAWTFARLALESASETAQGGAEALARRVGH